MSNNDYTYTPTHVPCPICGFMIPYADISMNTMYVCPACHKHVSAGINSLSLQNSEKS